MAIDPLNYIRSNKTVFDFVQAISRNTEADRLEVWEKHARTNRGNVKRCGWSSTEFFGKGEGKAAIIIGASPALANQIDQLRKLQDDGDFILIGISAGIRYLLQNGIKPDYTFISDSSDKMLKWFEGIEDTSGMTLCADITANPDAVALWEEKGGIVKYHAVYSAIKSLDKKIKKWYRPVNGTGDFLNSLSSQYNSAVQFAFLVLCSNVLIFVGNELSFPSKDGNKDRYYVDRTDEKDHWIRRPHKDIYGNRVYTTFMFYQMKLVLEDFLGMVSGAGWFFNATEAGIFGVTKDGPVPWIRQFKLPMAIAQARHIIRTGQPITEKKLIEPVNNIITVANAPFISQGENHVRLQRALPSL